MPAEVADYKLTWNLSDYSGYCHMQIVSSCIN